MHLNSDCVRAIVMCYFGLPVDYLEEPGVYRAYESVIEALSNGSDPIP